MKFVLTFAKSDLTISRNVYCNIIFGLDICQDLYRSTPKVLGKCPTVISYSDIGVEGGVRCNRWVTALTQHFRLHIRILMTNTVNQSAGDYQPGGYLLSITRPLCSWMSVD